MSRLSDPAAVAAQYARPDNFDARVRLYRLYATSRPSWLEWLFDQIGPQAGERVLDVGAGPGNVWAENAERLPEARIALGDRSPGMLAAAGERLGSLQTLAGKLPCLHRLDAQALPFADQSFDVTIACHMLYHVPDRNRALSELARVLKPSGRCHVATNDWTHQIEVRELVTRFGVETTMVRVGRDDAIFDLETAAEELSVHFEKIRVARRHDHLQVSDARILGDYVRSACPADPGNLARIDELEQHVARQIEIQGSFHLTVAAGVCKATGPSPLPVS
jgi:ubiquinone/menaquinone biosynthesis C-methylase UbiE